MLAMSTGSAADPGTAAVSYVALGNSLLASGDTRQAIEAFRAAVVMGKNARSLTGTALAMARLSEAYAASGDAARSEQECSRAVSVARDAVEDKPREVTPKWTLCICLRTLGTLFAGRELHAGGHGTIRLCGSHRRRTTREHPDRPDLSHQLADLLRRSASTRVLDDQVDAASALYERACECLARLAGHDRSNFEAHDKLASCWTGLQHSAPQAGTIQGPRRPIRTRLLPAMSPCPGTPTTWMPFANSVSASRRRPDSGCKPAMSVDSSRSKLSSS